MGINVRDDATAMERGEWFDHPDFDDVEIQVISPMSEPVRLRRAQLLEKARGAEGEDAQLAGEKIEMQVAAACLVGWKGIDDPWNEDGGPLEFSRESANRMAEDKGFWSFLRGATRRANMVGSARRRQVKESTGN